MRDFKPENIAQITLKIKEQWVPMVATLKACLFPPTNGPSFKVFHGQGTFHHVEPSDFGLRFFRENGTKLVGGFNPPEKYDRQNGNLPQIGVKIKNI